MATNFEVKVATILNEIASELNKHKKRFIKVGTANDTYLIPIDSICNVYRKKTTEGFIYEVTYKDQNSICCYYINEQTYDYLNNYFCV